MLIVSRPVRCVWVMLLQGAMIVWLVIVPREVDAWGTLGHEIVGNLAWTLVTPQTRDQIRTLLLLLLHNNNSTTISTIRQANNVRNDPCQEYYCSPLAVVADWADRVRYYEPWSAPLHYIDVQDDIIPGGCPIIVDRATTYRSTNPQCQFMYTRDCVNNTCVAGAILNYTKVLDYQYNDPNTTNPSHKDLQEDLKFLVHFVGDIHQPLHCARKTDKGGNSIHLHSVWKNYNTDENENNVVVSFRSLRSNMQRLGYSTAISSHQGLNLHHVWDDTFIDTALSESGFNGSRNALELDLMNDIWLHRQDWDEHDCADGRRYECVNTWANDSLNLAMQYAYSDENGQPITNGSTLSRQYYESRMPIVRLQLAKAGYRLASTLDLIFGVKSAA